MQGADRFELQIDRRRLLKGGEPVALGGRAYDLLVALWERRTRVVEKAELLELVWPGLMVEENNLQVQVGHLRKVLGADAIATVAGRGYRLTVDLEATSPGPPAAQNDLHPALPAESQGASLTQLFALLRDCEAGLAGAIDPRALEEAIAACRRLVLIERLTALQTPAVDSGRANAVLDIDGVRKALTATGVALELLLAARAISANSALPDGPSDAPREPPEAPAGHSAGVHPPWE